ncbi:hypothetical protein C0Q70_09010 [Pomacea canaliculata]|uniref:Uncharacterized protein n=1 Tax=Pomacea canaliculata TaxID=400727 RepID=A0A2T7P8L2_POMCA|nr:hypothetical protein C0Q70_09010 [Pomacea canaliculata]
MRCTDSHGRKQHSVNSVGLWGVLSTSNANTSAERKSLEIKYSNGVTEDRVIFSVVDVERSGQRASTHHNSQRRLQELIEQLDTSHMGLVARRGPLWYLRTSK